MISVDIPRVWNHHEWIQAFEKFLDVIDVHHVRVLFATYTSSTTSVFFYFLLFFSFINIV